MFLDDSRIFSIFLFAIRRRTILRLRRLCRLRRHNHHIRCLSNSGSVGDNGNRKLFCLHSTSLSCEYFFQLFPVPMAPVCANMQCAANSLELAVTVGARCCQQFMSHSLHTRTRQMILSPAIGESQFMSYSQRSRILFVKFNVLYFEYKTLNR